MGSLVFQKVVCTGQPVLGIHPQPWLLLGVPYHHLMGLESLLDTRILVIWLPTALPSGSIIVTPNGFWADFMSIWCPKVNWQTHSATENTASRSFSIWVYLPSVPIKALPALLRRFCLSAAPRHCYPYDTSNYPPVKLKVLKEGTGLVTAPALSLLTVLDLLTITKPHKCIKPGNLGNYSESTPPACPQLDLFLTIQFLHF